MVDGQMETNIRKVILVHGITPLTVLTLYFVGYSYFISWLVPRYGHNVNAVFVNSAWKYPPLLAAAMLIIYLALGKAGKGAGQFARTGREKLSAGDLVLVLLPLSPVVQYVINNFDILSPLGSLYVLGVFALFSLFLTIVVPLFLGMACSAGTLMILGMSFTFMITNMAALSVRYRWLGQGSLMTQLAIFSAIFFAGRLLASLIGRKVLYVFIAVFFIANSVIRLAGSDWTGRTVSGADAANKLLELAGGRAPATKPNIYLLVYDAYVINETMLAYGIDNNAQEEYLENLGFTIYPHTYSVGSLSIDSMSRTLNASTEYHGDRRRGVSGDGLALNLLRGFGYETYGIFQSDYFFRGISSSYDFSFPQKSKAPHKLLAKAIFMGEFRFEVAFDQPSIQQFDEFKSKIFSDIPITPRIVYMHDPRPNHSQNSGICRPDETDLFRERLIEANHQMRLDLETIIQGDPGAIIIVAGDHGPYLTKNCIGTGPDYHISEISRLDIQDRFGAFLAIRWPGENFSEYDDIVVLQDIFPAIFGYIFRDRGFLQARIEARTLAPDFISGAEVVDGIIRGGINDGEPLFLGPK